MPSAMTASSSTIRTFAILVCGEGGIRERPRGPRRGYKKGCGFARSGPRARGGEPGDAPRPRRGAASWQRAAPPGRAWTGSRRPAGAGLSCSAATVGTSPSGCRTRSRGGAGAPLPEPARRARRLRGAQGRLHGGRLARGCGPARAPASPCWRRRRRPGAGHLRRSSSRRGRRSGTSASSSTTSCSTASWRPDGPSSCSARRGPFRWSGAMRHRIRGDCRPRRRRRQGARRSAAELFTPTAHTAGRRREPRPGTRSATRAPGAAHRHRVPGRLTRSRTTARESPRRISPVSSSGSSGRTMRGRGERGSAWRS